MEIVSRPQPRSAASRRTTMPEFGLLLLAAGRGTRFGANPKLLQTWRGKPLVRHAAEAALGSGLGPAVAVLGAHGDAVAAALHGLDLARVTNPTTPRGSPLPCGPGSRPCRTGWDAVLVLLADMPRITTPRHLVDLPTRFELPTPRWRRSCRSMRANAETPSSSTGAASPWISPAFPGRPGRRASPGRRGDVLENRHGRRRPTGRRHARRSRGAALSSTLSFAADAPRLASARTDPSSSAPRPRRAPTSCARRTGLPHWAQILVGRSPSCACAP